MPQLPFIFTTLRSRRKMEFGKKVYAESDLQEDVPEPEPEEEEEEEDLVDPQEELKENCSERKDCVALKERLDVCNARVESKTKTSESCVEEIIDFMHCVDHCVAKTLFSKLK